MSILFTQEGYDTLVQEANKLRSERPAAVEELARARALGDLKENGFYHGAKAKLVGIDRRIREIERLLKKAQIIKKRETDLISVGSIVHITDGKATKIYTIVGEYEANPSAGKISHVSPLGKALMGKKAGEDVLVILPSGTNTFTITQVS